MEQLNDLNNKSLNYYSEITESFYSLKNYLNRSITEINNLLNQCFDITYKTFYNKYEEISNETELVDYEENQIDEQKQTLSHIINSENIYYIVDTEITEYIKKGRFKVGIEYEDNNKNKPKFYSSIFNQCRPNKISFSIYSGVGTCGKNGQNIEILFNNVNLTTNLDFNTNSNNISVTSITDFDNYQYSIENFKIEDISETNCFTLMHINFCFDIGKCDKVPNYSSKIVKTESKKYSVKKYSFEA